MIAFRWAVVMFSIGFFKKACVSDNFAPYVDAFFGNPDGYSVADSWLAVCLYAAQIYCDFSGYSDMAVSGLAGCCRYLDPAPSQGTLCETTGFIGSHTKARFSRLFLPILTVRPAYALTSRQEELRKMLLTLIVIELLDVKRLEETRCRSAK